MTTSDLLSTTPEGICPRKERKATERGLVKTIVRREAAGRHCVLRPLLTLTTSPPAGDPRLLFRVFPFLPWTKSASRADVKSLVPGGPSAIGSKADRYEVDPGSGERLLPESKHQECRGSGEVVQERRTYGHARIDPMKSSANAAYSMPNQPFRRAGWRWRASALPAAHLSARGRERPHGVGDFALP